MSKVVWTDIQRTAEVGGLSVVKEIHIMPVVEAPVFPTAEEAEAFAQRLADSGVRTVTCMSDGEEKLFLYRGHSLSAKCVCGPHPKAADHGIPMYVHQRPN